MFFSRRLPSEGRRKWRYSLRSWFVVTLVLGVFLAFFAKWIAEERARRALVTQVYPVQAVLTYRKFDQGVQPQYDLLIARIKQSVEPNSWDDAGGLGTIQAYENNFTVVVTQSPQAHQEIERILARRADGKD